MVRRKLKYIALIICGCWFYLGILPEPVYAAEEYQNHIRRLLRWPREIDSPFLLLDEDQERTLRRMEHDDVVGPLRAAVLERSRGYSDPDSQWYLGPPELRRAMGLRQANTEMMRYFCLALLDMGFVSFVEYSRDVRNDGQRLLLGTIEDLQRDYQLPADRSASEILILSSELAAGITLAYDLLEQSLDTKERGPAIEFIEEERRFLSSLVHRRFPEVEEAAQRAEIAACLGLTTLFSSSKFADREDRRDYQNRYSGYVNDLLWAIDVCLHSWEELEESEESLEPETLAYPAYYSILFAAALRRAGGPDLRSDLPFSAFVSSIEHRRIPGEALIVDAAASQPEELAPDTWPPALRNPFWIDGEGPETGAPQATPTATPHPTPTLSPMGRMIEVWKRIGEQNPTPTPTPSRPEGWSPQCIGGRPSVWGSVVFYSALAGNTTAQQIWNSGGSIVSSHPATLAHYKFSSPFQPRLYKREESLCLSEEKDLVVVRSSLPNDTVFAREVVDGGRITGNYLFGDKLRRRILERVELVSSDHILSGTEQTLKCPGYIYSANNESGVEWSTVFRTSSSLGFPYLVSVVRCASGSSGKHFMDLPIASTEDVIGGTSTPPFITVTAKNERTFSRGAAYRDSRPVIEETHLRLIFSSLGRAHGRIAMKDNQRYLRVSQPLANGAAFSTLLIDSLSSNRTIVESVELDAGAGIVLPWEERGKDLIAVSSGKGIHGPTIKTDAALVIVSWDLAHDLVAYLAVGATYLAATPSLREGPPRYLIDRSREPVTVGWSGKTLVFAPGSSISGSFYAPDILSARKEDQTLFTHQQYHRVTLSEKPPQAYRLRVITGDRTLNQ